MHFFDQRYLSFPLRENTNAIWDRWRAIWHVLFYAVLLLTTLALVLNDTFPWWDYLVIFGLSFLLAAWYFICVRVNEWYWDNFPLLTLGYLALGWLLWLCLIIPFPIYLFLLFALYPQTFFLPRMPWKFLAATLLSVLSLWRQFSGLGFLNSSFIFSLAISVGGIVMAIFIEQIASQSQQRSRLIAELEATRKELAERERQNGIIGERQRLAREIHDTLAQGFTSIILQREAIQEPILSDPTLLQEHLNQLSHTARESLAEARRMMWALQPEAFEHTSLPEVLTGFSQRWTEKSGIPVEIHITGTPYPLLPEIDVILLRATQEALANTYKHAHANHITLTLSFMDALIALDIEDDGSGFEQAILLHPYPDQLASRFGLRALRERVEQWEGTFTLESAPGQGTTLAIALPIRDPSPVLPTTKGGKLA
jgi:signal transduction histidine kinase